MKTPLLIVILMLLCLPSVYSAVVRGPDVLKDGCCLQISQNVIPKAKVKDVKMTPSHCKKSQTALIVTAMSGTSYCIKHDLKWSKKLLENFKNPTSAATPRLDKTSAPTSTP
ncbi:uncharacterized protein KZ484_001160 [Pholidichthys leucotaenia]